MPGRPVSCRAAVSSAPAVIPSFNSTKSLFHRASVLLLGITAGLLLLSGAAHAAFVNELIANGNFPTGSKGSDMVMEGNTAHTAYIWRDADFNYELRYTTGISGGSWSYQTITTEVDAYTQVSFDLAPDGRPFVCYGNAMGNTLSLAWWNGTSWSTSTIFSQANAKIYNNGLAVDMFGNAHVVFSKYDGVKYGITYACFTPESGWSYSSVEDSASPSEFISPEVSIAISRDGVIHVAYSYIAVGPIRRFYLASLNGGTWTSQVIDNDAVGSLNDIAFSKDAIHMTYRDTDANSALVYARCNYDGTNLSTCALANYDGSDTEKHNIVIDGNGIPHVAYRGTGQMYYSSWTGTGFSYTGVPGQTPARLDFDAAGHPNVIYYYYGGGGSNLDTIGLTRDAANTQPVRQRNAWPKNFAASTVWASSATWSWTDRSNNEVGYDLITDTYGAASGVLAVNTTVYTETGLSPNTWYTRGARSLGVGDFAFSNTARRCTLATTPAGENMAIYFTSVTLSVDPKDNPIDTVYSIEIDADGNLTPFDTTKYVQMDGTLGDIPIWQTSTAWGQVWVVGLSTATRYYGSIAVMNRELVVSRSIPGEVLTKVDTPTDVYAVTATSATISVAWSTATNPAGIAYTCEISTSNNFGGARALTSSSIPIVFEDGFTSDTTYYIRVRGVFGGTQFSEYSEVLTTVTAASVPGMLGMTARTSTGIQITTILANGNPDWTLYSIAIDTDDNTVPFDSTAYLTLSTATTATVGMAEEWRKLSQWDQATVVSLSTNTVYFFKIRAKNAAGAATAWTAAVQRYTYADAVPPTIVSVSSTSFTFTINTGENPPDTLYAVMVDTDNDGAILPPEDQLFVQLDGSLTASDTCYTEAEAGAITVSNLNYNSRYHITTIPIKEDDIYGSIMSSTVSFYTRAVAPGAPVLVSTAATGLLVDVDPDVNPSNTQFAIAVDDDGDTFADFAPLKYLYPDGSLQASATWYTDTEWNNTRIILLSTNTFYCAQVKARNGDAVETGWSAAASTYTLAAIPVNFNFVAVSSDSVSLQWDTNGNAAGTKYWVQYYHDYNGQAPTSFVDVSTLTATTLYHGGLRSGTTHFYKIWAVSSGGNGTSSVTISTVTALNDSSTLTQTAISTGSFTFALAPGSNNSATLTAVQIDNDGDENAFDVVNYLQADGSISNTPVWRTAAAWGTIATGGLPSNTLYRWRLALQDVAGRISPQYLSTQAKYTWAATPGALTTADAGENFLQLTTNASGNPVMTQYGIEIDDDDDDVAFNTVKFVKQANELSLTTTGWFTAAAWDSTGINCPTRNGLYRFRQFARNGDGVITGYSPVLTAYTLAREPAANFAGADSDTLRVAWTNTFSNAARTLYVCELSTSNTFVPVQASTASAVLSTDMCGLQTNTTYFVRVRARNGGGLYSNYSTIISTSTMPQLPPVILTTVADTSRIRFTIGGNPNPAYTEYTFIIDTNNNDDIFDCTGYLLLSGSDIVFGGAPQWLPWDDWNDKYLVGLSTDTRYYYKIAARNSQNRSTGYGATTYANTRAALPGEVNFVAASSYTVTVSIDPSQNPESTKFTVCVDDDGDNNADFAPVKYLGLDGKLTASATYYTKMEFGSVVLNDNLLPNVPYRFRTRARSGGGDETAFTTGVDTYTCAAPAPAPTVTNTAYTTSLTVNIDPGANPVAPSWIDTEFAVLVDDDGNATADLSSAKYVQADGTLSTTPAWFTDAAFGAKNVINLSTNTLYYVGVKAKNENDVPTTVITPASLYTRAAVPVSPQVTATTYNTATLAWGANGNPTANTSYVVQYYHDYPSLPPASFVTAFTTACAETGMHTAIKSGTTQFYRIYAKNGNDLWTTGEYSPIVSTITYPSPTSTLSIAAISATEISIIPSCGDNHPDTTLTVAIDTSTNALSFDTTGYLQVDGTIGAASVWLKDAAWGTKIAAGLMPNSIYRFKVNARDPLGRTAYRYSNEAWKYTLANMPQSTSISAVYPSSMTVSWLAESNPSGTEYELWRSPNNANYNLVTVIIGTSTVSCAYTDTGLSANTTYYYKVRARNAEGVYTAFDTIVAKCSIMDLPAAPAVVVLSSTAVSVDIQPVSDPADTQYAIVIDTDTDATAFNTSASVQEDGSLSSTVDWHTDAEWGAVRVDNLQVNKLYRFQVLSRNRTGATSAPGSAAAKYTFANPPANVMVFADVYDLVVNWDANNNPDSTAYRAACSLTADFATTVSSGVIGTSAMLAGLAPNTTYYVRLRAENGDGEGAPVNWLPCGTIVTVSQLPAAAACSDADVTSIRANWTANGNPAGTLYIVDASTGSVFSWPVMQIETTALYADFTSLLSNTTYYFRVAACGHGDFTTPTVSLGAQMTKSAVPANLAITNELDAQVTLCWTGSGVEKFAVQRSTDGLAWAMLHTFATALTTATYTDTGLTPETTYWYRVWGYNRLGVLSSEPSNTVLKRGLKLLSNTAGGIQTAGDGTSIELPASAAGETVLVVIRTDPEHQPKEIDPAAIHAANDNNDGGLIVPIPNTIREFLAYTQSGVKIEQFNQYLVIAIPYPDENNDGYIDGVVPRIPVNALRMYTLNTTRQQWEPVDNASVNTQNRSVQSQVRHLSVYRLMAPTAASALTNVIIYPNPFRPNGTATNAAFAADHVTFSGLTAAARIKIFSLSGNMVDSFDEASDGIAGDGIAVWGAVNSAGEKLATGMYLYVITDDNDNKKTGLIGIVR